MNKVVPLVDGRLWRGKSAPEGVAVEVERALLVPLFTRWHKIEYLAEISVWFVAFGIFWAWWLLPAHYIGPVRFLCVTLPFAWFTLATLHFLFVIRHGRVPAKNAELPAGSGVAMVVTKTPSEPFSTVAETLEAMLRQTYPHDTWIADEDPTPDTLAWCEQRGVRVSTRKGHPDYHRPDWPRRARCKEGNLAFFYDHYGYLLYDFVIQMDADHAPTPTYLSEMLKPFADPRVGYVTAPSICDKNVAQSWSARGRLYSEAMTHGPLQAGYTGAGAPLCVGSHYAVRTTALKAIGGLGPELAEDHSTTLMMSAHGWRGAHALDAIAHGEGPRTLADLVTQELQWSRSLMTILLRYTPVLLPHLPVRLRFRFVFWQLWYPAEATFWALMFVNPIFALLTRKNLIDVTYADFFLHFTPISLMMLLIAYRWRAHGLLRPVKTRVVSWEAILYVVAKWPWALMGSMLALSDWATNSVSDFRVTPKGTGPVGLVPFRVLAPYVAISLASALAALLLDDVGTARGFYIFAIFNAALYATLILVIVVRHSLENRLGWRKAGFRLAAQTCVAATLLTLPVAATVARGPEALEAIAWGAGPISLTRSLYLATGAGMGRGVHKVYFQPSWNFGPDAPPEREP